MQNKQNIVPPFGLRSRYITPITQKNTTTATATKAITTKSETSIQPTTTAQPKGKNNTQNKKETMQKVRVTNPRHKQEAGQWVNNSAAHIYIQYIYIHTYVHTYFEVYTASNHKKSTSHLQFATRREPCNGGYRLHTVEDAASGGFPTLKANTSRPPPPPPLPQEETRYNNGKPETRAQTPTPPRTPPPIPRPQHHATRV